MKKGADTQCDSPKTDGRARPNLLVIHTDQQSCWSVSAYGGTRITTPNIDRIGLEGAIATNFFANSAVCTPSRGCLLTGRYPHAHGAYKNNIPLNRDEITFAQILKDRGYHTGYSGKWHLDGQRRPGWVHENRGMGFTDNEYMFNRGHWKKIADAAMQDVQPTVYPYKVIGDEKTYPTDWLAEKTIAFIEAHREKPFCYMLSIPDPHGPVWVRAPYDSLFHPADMHPPSTFSDENIPSWAKAAQLASGQPEREKRLREFLALYCGEVKLIDDVVGRIVSCLEKEGLLDDTILVFTSDHGEYAGEHGLMGKNQLYETAHRVPMLVRYPKEIGRGTTIENVFSTVDFQSTILGLMGIEPSGREQGHDASPLLRGEEVTWHDEAFIHHSSLKRAGIFTPEFQLAYVENAEAIFFDRKNDPNQVNNLFDHPIYKGIIAELTHKIIEHNVAIEAPAARWLKQMQIVA